MSEIIFKSFITNWCVKVYEAEMDKINYNIKKPGSSLFLAKLPKNVFYRKT